MQNIDKQVEAVDRLITYFGGQVKLGSALNVGQGTISGWRNGKHGISPFNAQKAERLTKGAVKAVDLCPALAELEEG